MIKKLVKFFPGIAALTFVLSAHVCSAAVDSDFTAAIASSTALITDNKGTILAFIAVMVGLVLAIKLGKVALVMAAKKITGAFAGRRKK